MVVIALGNGLFLPNLPSQVTSLYPKGDPRAARRSTSTTSGINLGAFLAPLICGTLGEVYGWHYGFGAAGIGMCLGLLVYVVGRQIPAGRSSRAAERTESVQDGGRAATRHHPAADRASRWRSCCSASPTSRPATRSRSGPTPLSSVSASG
jgi:dipeptide/tripeptide permease